MCEKIYVWNCCEVGRLSDWVVARLPLTCLTSQSSCERWREVHSVHCVFSECENRMSVHFCLCVVSRGECCDVIVVDGGIFLSRCLIVASPCGC